MRRNMVPLISAFAVLVSVLVTGVGQGDEAAAAPLCPEGATKIISENGKPATYTCSAELGWFRLAEETDTVESDINSEAHTDEPPCQSLFEIGCYDGVDSPRYSRGVYFYSSTPGCDLRTNALACPPATKMISGATFCPMSNRTTFIYWNTSGRAWHICPESGAAEEATLVPRFHYGDLEWQYFAAPVNGFPVPVKHTNYYNYLDGNWEPNTFAWCSFSNSCHFGHDSYTANGHRYSGWSSHESLWQYKRLTLKFCGALCDDVPGTTTTTTPSTTIPEEPTQVTPVRIEVTVDVPAVFRADGMYTPQRATVTRIELICEPSCDGPGAPKIELVDAQLTIDGGGGYRACRTASSSGCEFLVTATDRRRPLQVGDYVEAAFFSPTGEGELVQIDLNVFLTQVQTYTFALGSGGWVAVEGDIVSVPVVVTPASPIVRQVLGTNGS